MSGAGSSLPKGFKPKFVPKVPIKKEPNTEPPTDSAASSAGVPGVADGTASAPSTAAPAARTGGPKANGDGGEGWKHRRQKQHQNQQQHRQKHRWVMPTGATFFTGGSTSGIPGGGAPSAMRSGMRSDVSAAGAAGDAAAAGAGQMRIARPNEIIEDLPTSLGGVRIKSELGSSGQQKITPTASLTGEAGGSSATTGVSDYMEVASVDR